MSDEKKRSGIIFLMAAFSYYESLGINVPNLNADSLTCSLRWRAASFRFREHLRAVAFAGLHHVTLSAAPFQKCFR
jgi:hypothetical protein